MRDPQVLTKALRAFLKSPLTHAQLNAALGGKYLNVSGITKRLMIQGHIAELDRVHSGTRGAHSIRFVITELGRRHLDPKEVPSPDLSDDQRYQLLKAEWVAITKKLSRETYRRFQLKYPEYSDLPYERLTPVNTSLCDSDDCPFPNCHGYPGGPPGFRKCIFCYGQDEMDEE